VVSGATQRLERFSIDSRTLAPGQFFIALQGDRFDGAAFAPATLERGASGVMLCRHARLAESLGAAWPDRSVIEVDDTLAGLQALGRQVRRSSLTRVTAITGSAGKTTTKEAAADFLATRYHVYRNAGNLNNHVGLPLSLLDLVTCPDVAVVELGMNHLGEISQLVAIAEPEVRVWTNVGEAHVGHFASVEEIADAKAEIFEGASAASLLVANADDDRVMTRAPRFPGRIVTFGTGDRADVRATHVEDLGIEGTRAWLHTPAAGSARLEVRLVGRGNLMNVLAAIAVALEFDVPVSAVIARAALLKPARHRGERVALRDGVTLLDDSYNSSPSALRRTLEAVSRDRAHKRRVAVLGEMLELGAFSPALHEECGRATAAAHIDMLIAVGGPPAYRLAEAAVAAGMPASAVRYVSTSEDAAALTLRTVKPGDLVVVKGSRGIRTDVVVDRLTEEWR
jgi:UDP-N-acetylmuramoyl-tripeptide--D-alanyl-D-alanine ligase